MSETEREFRERLLGLESHDPAQRQNYERQVKKMLEQKISAAKRLGFALLAALGLLGAVYYGPYFFKDSGGGDMAFVMRMFMLPPFFLSIAWTILTGWVAVGGRLNFRTQRPYIAAIALAMGFFLIVTLMFAFLIPIALDNKPVLGTQLALMGFFMLMTIGMCVTLTTLYRTQFSNQEKLLEIEYRLADLAEKMETKRS